MWREKGKIPMGPSDLSPCHQQLKEYSGRCRGKRIGGLLLASLPTLPFRWGYGTEEVFSGPSSPLPLPLPPSQKRQVSRVLRPYLPPTSHLLPCRDFFDCYGRYRLSSQIPQVQKLCLLLLWTPTPKPGTELNLAMPNKSFQAY